ncbi:MAG: hypothetical protein ACPGRX_03200 [Bdellovibrionales bacterium]
MTKPHLILWGGSWDADAKPIVLGDLDSHAKVSLFFLKDALSRYFSLSCIENFDAIVAGIFDHLREDTIGVLSTFQAGFTQLRQKKPEIYQKIVPHLKGKKFSIIDETTFRRTCEDRLFTVIAPDFAVKNRLHTLLSPSKAHYMGWCASPEHCYPEDKKSFTVFVDHGHYAGIDYTAMVMDALAKTKAERPIRVFIQGNAGVREWDLAVPWAQETYERANKVPWAQMMAHYRQADLFCLTHLESAGLSAIEAAMCGARLIVPKTNGRAFLHGGLLKPPLDFVCVDCDAEALRACFAAQIRMGVDRQRNHETLKAGNSWDQAAQRIYNVLAPSD